MTLVLVATYRLHYLNRKCTHHSTFAPAHTTLYPNGSVNIHLLHLEADLLKHLNEYEPGDADPVCINRYELIKCVELCRQAIDTDNVASYFALKALLFCT